MADPDRNLARDVDADGFLLVPFSDVQVLDVLGTTTRVKKLILLADDSPLIHRHTVPILEDEGYEVRSAHDGREAIELARALSPDLVITDVEMPLVDGYGVCAALKRDAATAHTPVLICSTLGEKAADLERGFEAGADDYLVKPVLPEELATRVRALVQGSLPGSRERVLVVDDSPAQRHYVADCLSRQGFVVTTAEDGKAALAKAMKRIPRALARVQFILRNSRRSGTLRARLYGLTISIFAEIRIPRSLQQPPRIRRYRSQDNRRGDAGTGKQTRGGGDTGTGQGNNSIYKRAGIRLNVQGETDNGREKSCLEF